jgi:hypothetical protein
MFVVVVILDSDILLAFGIVVGVGILVVVFRSVSVLWVVIDCKEGRRAASVTVRYGSKVWMVLRPRDSSDTSPTSITILQARCTLPLHRP